MTERIGVDGKQFRSGRHPFSVRGVTYGTFRTRSDGEPFPDRQVVKRDFAAISAAGFNTVRTYTLPPDDVLELAADWDLRLLAGVFYEDWRYLVGASARQRQRMAREARNQIRQAARRLTGTDQVLGIVVGNELPVDVVRWLGRKHSIGLISSLAETVAEQDPEQLKTYGNFPTTEFLHVEQLDFLLFNVFLEDRPAYRRYLTKLQYLAGDRPLVLGEIGLDAGVAPRGPVRQAEVLEWQLETATERGLAGVVIFSWTDEWCVGDHPVDGWHFGLTRTDRSARPALAAAQRWNEQTVRNIDVRWPPMSVVICAYNAAVTLDECLRHTCALDYPDLEIVVVNDGSTDGTSVIAQRYPKVRLVETEHAGLSSARNQGLWASRGEVVAYLDADAYPTPQWPYFLALAFDAPDVAGVGGPNLPPPSDPLSAHCVARAPGGPVHVLLTNDRAEHVPGCNMAFRRDALIELGGFDPVFERAGDDVDLCWRLLDRGGTIGFHPAAVVWHHPRSTTRAYLRQQWGYGRSEALVQARHPERFTALGRARWKGTIYRSATPRLGRQSIYQGIFGVAPFQSVYRSGGHHLDIANHVGVLAAVALILTAPLGFLSGVLALPALTGVLMLAGLAAANFVHARPPVLSALGKGRAKAAIAGLTLLQPLARAAGRASNRRVARRGAEPAGPPPRPAGRAGNGVLLYADDRDRAALAAAVVGYLRHAGLRVVSATGWEDYDARIAAPPFLWGELVTTAHPMGCIQLRVRRRLRWLALLLSLALLVVAAKVSGYLFLAALSGVTVALLRAMYRTGRYVDRVLDPGGSR